MENMEKIVNLGYKLSDSLIKLDDSKNPDKKIDAYLDFQRYLKKMRLLFPPLAEAYEKMYYFVTEQHKKNNQ